MGRHPFFSFMGILSLIVLCCTGVNSRKQGYDYYYMEDDCRVGPTLDLEDTDLSLYGFVRVTREASYDPNMSCAVRVVAPRYHQLTTRVRWVDTDCDHAYLEITGSNKSTSDPIKVCGESTPSGSVYSTGGELNFRFVSDHTELEKDRRGFDLYYTAYHKDGCDSNEFRCYIEHRCIPKEVKCDEMDNCGDWSDEYRGTCGLSTAAIITISLVCVVGVGACVGCCIYVYWDDKKQKKEQSRRRRNNEATVEYVRTTAANNPGYDANLPPNQYAAGTEPPPPYTYSFYPTPGNEKEMWPVSETNTVSAGQATGDPSAGPQATCTPSALHVPENSVPGVENPGYGTTESSATSQGATALPCPNMPPPVYEELPPVVET